MSGKGSKSKAAAKVPLSDRPGPLKREDVLCSICWSIFIEPVTLPCGHALCCTCFKKHVAETSLQCPCCRMRISVWSRRAFKQNNLVDKKLWERIQREFPKLVQTRLLGEDSQNLQGDDLVSIFDKNIPLSTGGGHINQSPSPLAIYENNVDDNENDKFPVEAILKRDGEISLGNGELKRELEEMNKKHMEDIENERRMEENESQQLIRQLQTEATNRANEEEEEDRRLAEQLAEQEKKELGAAINARRKLFTESTPLTAGSSSFSGNLPKTPNNSKKSYSEATTPRRHTGGKRTSFSLSGSAERPNNKKQKSGRLTLSQPSPASGGSGQNSQNSILKYISSSSQQQQQSNTSPCSQSSSSSVLILSSPKPSTSTAAKLQYKLAQQDTPGSSFVSASSAFSSIKPVNKGLAAQVVPSKSLIYQQSILKPMNRTEKGEILMQSNEFDETGGASKDSERDIPTPNSIDLEVNYHFRPIRSAPKTPPQKLPDGSFLPEPLMVKTTPVKLVPCVIIDISGNDDDENSQRMDNDYDLEPERESEFNISCIPLESLQDPSENTQGSPNSQLNVTNSPFYVEHHDAQPTINFDDNAPLDTLQVDETDSAQADLPDSQDSQVSANIDLGMVKKQAEELKRIRERQLQEEMDLRLARKLQKELNQLPSRRTEEENPFSLRNWLNNKRQSTTTSSNCTIGCSEPSTSSHANNQRGEAQQPTRRSTRRSHATIPQDTFLCSTLGVKDETTE
ncbi:uncharacterized protein LOC110852355 isoform X2 [Folsomia candida]|uniref:uncharacterized protein LOC110852355 isoform X2 n=1 Tax=Folsomia candida TaxID=158441 RepID=UPI000B9053A1|nr:uncharacterized protein LOC110852355 isoform X2 [Folsomia candida]